MKTRIADASGFCFGVKRAISLAEDTLTEEPLYALGPLVHNPQEMRRLEPMGLAVVSDIELVPDGAVLLIRAHGAASEVYAAAEYKRLRVIDATCPHVKKLLSKAADFVQQGYQLLIVGDANHPEVQAAQAWARGSALVITGPEEIATLPLSDRVAIVAQTTTKLHVWEAVLQELRSRVPNLEIGYTICHATKERQQAAQELSKQVDIMVVVGGHNSANTRNLVQLCSEIGTPTHHVETAADLDPSWFKPGALVGITAGASTPDWIIKEVVTTVENMENKNNEVMEESTLEKPAEEVTSAEVTAAEAENVAPCQCEEQECECESGEKTEEATNMADVAGDMINIRTGQIVEGTVVRVTESEVFVDIRYKSDGVIQANELSNLPNVQPSDVVKEGDVIKAVVLRLENREGNVVLSKRRADAEEGWKLAEEAFAEDKIVSGQVTEVVKGGLIVNLFNLRAFLPASLV
ncbi:MAG TPA: 4-hydroxy-3-methylbut-2-enyl diphosphate reductase, partial [Firmicutes bacterium]|nr:4-hydroxy-3-methylbut-2-enyl diphosphate reductase [Bacillota bacterium]